MKVSDLRALLRGMDSEEEVLVHMWTRDDALEMCDQLCMSHISKADWRKVIREFNREEHLARPIVSFIENRLAHYTDEMLEDDEEYEEL